MTLTIEEIYNLAVYAGLMIDDTNSIAEDERGSEITIFENAKMKLDDGSTWTGRGACFTEYPEDRSVIIKEYDVK